MPALGALEISSAVAITNNLFAASFLILMASLIGNRFFVIQGGKRGTSQSPFRGNRLTLVRKDGEEPPSESPRVSRAK